MNVLAILLILCILASVVLSQDDTFSVQDETNNGESINNKIEGETTVVDEVIQSQENTNNNDVIAEAVITNDEQPIIINNDEQPIVTTEAEPVVTKEEEPVVVEEIKQINKIGNDNKTVSKFIKELKQLLEYFITIPKNIIAILKSVFKF